MMTAKILKLKPRVIWWGGGGKGVEGTNRTKKKNPNKQKQKPQGNLSFNSS